MAMCVGLSFSLSLFLSFSLSSLSLSFISGARAFSLLFCPLSLFLLFLWPALAFALHVSVSRAVCLCLSRCMSLSLALYVSVSRAVCLWWPLSLPSILLLSCYYLPAISRLSPWCLCMRGVCELFSQACMRALCVWAWAWAWACAQVPQQQGAFLRYFGQRLAAGGRLCWGAGAGLSGSLLAGTLSLSKRTHSIVREHILQ